MLKDSQWRTWRTSSDAGCSSQKDGQRSLLKRRKHLERIFTVKDVVVEEVSGFTRPANFQDRSLLVLFPCFKAKKLHITEHYSQFVSCFRTETHEVTVVSLKPAVEQEQESPAAPERSTGLMQAPQQKTRRALFSLPPQTFCVLLLMQQPNVWIFKHVSKKWLYDTFHQLEASPTLRSVNVVVKYQITGHHMEVLVC